MLLDILLYKAIIQKVYLFYSLEIDYTENVGIINSYAKPIRVFTMIYFRICTYLDNEKLALSALPGKNSLTSEPIQSEGDDLDAQLWTPLLLPNIGSDACVLLNKLSGTFACVESTGLLSFGLGKKKPSVDLDVNTIFFPKNIGGNVGSVMQGLVEMQFKQYDDCIIGWKNPIDQKALVFAVSSGRTVEVMMGIKEFSLETLKGLQESLPMNFSGSWKFERFV